MSMPPISYSMRSKFKECPRLLYYRYIAGIEPVSNKSPSLAIGKCFHNAIEMIRIGHPVDSSISETSVRLAVILDDMGSNDEDIRNHAAKFEAYVLGYANHYNDSKFSWKTEFEINTGKEICYIDGLRLESDGSHVLVEDKTCSSFSAYLDFYLPHSEQILNYLRLIKNSTDIVVSSVAFRETKKTSCKKTKKEDWTEFSQRMIDEYSTDEKFRQEIITVPQKNITQYSREIKSLDIEIRTRLQHSESLYDWPRNTSSCHGKYGSCDFLPACGGCSDMDSIYAPRPGYEAIDNGKFLKKHKISKEGRL